MRDQGVRPQPAVVALELCEKKAAAVAEVWIVGLELVPMITQRQRLSERAGQRDEAPEMIDPLRVAERVQPHRRRRPLVPIAQDVFRESRRLDDIEEGFAKRRM
jgi:hypothetical protein